VALQRLLAGAFGPEHLHLGCRVEELEETRAGPRVNTRDFRCFGLSGV